MKLPAHIPAFAVGALVLALSTVLILTGHGVPSWWTWLGTAAVGGGLGIAVPATWAASAPPSEPAPTPTPAPAAVPAAAVAPVPVAQAPAQVPGAPIS